MAVIMENGGAVVVFRRLYQFFLFLLLVSVPPLVARQHGWTSADNPGKSIRQALHGIDYLNEKARDAMAYVWTDNQEILKKVFDSKELIKLKTELQPAMCTKLAKRIQSFDTALVNDEKTVVIEHNQLIAYLATCKDWLAKKHAKLLSPQPTSDPIRSPLPEEDEREDGLFDQLKSGIFSLIAQHPKLALLGGLVGLSLGGVATWKLLKLMKNHPKITGALLGMGGLGLGLHKGWDPIQWFSEHKSQAVWALILGYSVVAHLKGLPPFDDRKELED